MLFAPFWGKGYNIRRDMCNKQHKNTFYINRKLTFGVIHCTENY